MKHVYLGDGVYATPNPDDMHGCILTTGSHRLEDAHHMIFLEPQTIEALKKYFEEIDNGALRPDK